jgi:hypothetical protein
MRRKSCYFYPLGTYTMTQQSLILTKCLRKMLILLPLSYPITWVPCRVCDTNRANEIDNSMWRHPTPVSTTTSSKPMASSHRLRLKISYITKFNSRVLGRYPWSTIWRHSSYGLSVIPSASQPLIRIPYVTLLGGCQSFRNFTKQSIPMHQFCCEKHIHLFSSSKQHLIFHLQAAALPPSFLPSRAHGPHELYLNQGSKYHL